MHKKRHFTAVADRFTELFSAGLCGRRIVRHAGALDPLIAVARIERHDPDPVPDRQIELDGRRIFINARDRDHIRIPGHLLIQDIHLLVDIFPVRGRIVKDFDLIRAAVSQPFVDIFRGLLHAGPDLLPVGCIFRLADHGNIRARLQVEFIDIRIDRRIHRIQVRLPLWSFRRLPRKYIFLFSRTASASGSCHTESKRDACR